jgi:hypothetical protein
MKHYFFLFISFFFLLGIIPASAQDLPENDTVPVYVFSREDCKHCQNEKKFLTQLSEQYEFIEVSYLNIHEEPYATQWRDIVSLENLSLATPITVVANNVLLGFGTPETTGKLIEKLILDHKGKESLSPEQIIQQGGTEQLTQQTGEVCEDGVTLCKNPNEVSRLPQQDSVSIPFLGAIDVSTYSLPALSLILGFVDGFNPCALWVLITFLLVLSQTKSRKKMLMLAGFFILLQGIIYIAILNFWFTTWNFVQLDAIITPLVGLIALGGGIFFLYEWATATGMCKVVDTSKRQKIIQKIKNIASSPFNVSTLVAVSFLALSVSIIEFACSIGIPQAFTKILEINQLSFLGQQGMMGLYLLAYMIDDMIVFGIALWSIEKIGITTKYSIATNLIGGILMIFLGLLLIFAPQTLQFV